MRNFSCLVLASIFVIASGTACAQSTQSEIVAEALRINPTIASARLRVEETKSHVAEVAAQRRFQLTFGGLLSGAAGEVAEPPSAQGFLTAEASLTAPIPNMGKTGAQVDQALGQVAVAEAQLKRAELDVQFKASEAFIEVWRARENQTIASANLAQALRQADDTKKRIDAGTIPAADLLKVEVPVAQSKAALARAKIAESVALENLNDLLQRDLNRPLDISSPERPRLSIQPEEAVRVAMAHSPDVLEAMANLEATKAGLRIVRHERDLDTSLQLSHVRTSDPTSYSNLTTLSLNFTLPILDGGAARHQAKQAELQVAEAQSALKAVGRQVTLAVRQALLDVQGDEANATATAETEQLARESLDKAVQSYEAGLTTTRDVLDSQLIYSQARVDHSSAEYDFAVATAKLTQLLGGRAN